MFVFHNVLSADYTPAAQAPLLTTASAGINPTKNAGSGANRPTPAAVLAWISKTPWLASLAPSLKAAMLVCAVAERLVVRLPAAAERYPPPFRYGVGVAALVHNVNFANNPQRAVPANFYLHVCHS
jgi:hypothetical protein